MVVVCRLVEHTVEHIVEHIVANMVEVDDMQSWSSFVRLESCVRIDEAPSWMQYYWRFDSRAVSDREDA